MTRLLKAEIIKLKYNRMVFILALIILILGVGSCFATYIPGRVTYWDSGYMMPLIYNYVFGSFLPTFFGFAAAAVITEEVRQKTLYNALNCGNSRKKLFTVKVITFMGVGYLNTLISFATFYIGKTLIYGYNSLHYTYPHYGRTVFLMQAGTIVTMFTYMSILLCFALLFNHYVAVGLAGVAMIGFLEPDICGFPTWTVHCLYKLMASQQLVWANFAASVIPCLLAGCGFLILAYLIFMKKDMK